MQAYSTTADLKRYHPDYPSGLHDDEGFAEEEAESLIVPKHEAHDDLEVSKDHRRKPRVLYKQPKLKLTFISKQKDTKDQLRKSIMFKQQRSHQAKSLDVGRRESRRSLQLELLSDCIVKIRRTVVGDNISIPTFSLVDSKNIKNYISTSGSVLVYEQARQINTHGFIRNMIDQHSCFLEGEANQLLKMKLRDSFIMPKKQSKITRSIEFQGEYQNANLQFVSQVAEHEYELYLRNDTNTHGHQSWFLFKVKNATGQQQSITLHVCNLKRNFAMFNDGAKVYTRKIRENNQSCSQWEQGGGNIQFKLNNQQKFTNVRVYKLSFEVTVDQESTLEVGLLPAYTYSDMLKEIQDIKSSPNLAVDTLTYSLIGLAIPLLTFTRGNYPHKQVILINCRVHPGEANSSYMCKGLMRWLAEDSPAVRQFLDRHIVKVVPMLNPDGVLFGNFRTNFLGADLNRCFDTDDEITNPEISALKELGLKLRGEHGERFNLFLDLHGHSSQKNIFSYGPDFDTADTNFYQIRLFPKILNLKSRMFKYWSCTFKLEQYKRYTARGFFLNSVGTLAYTIEASYAFYQDEGKCLSMGHPQWTQFGSSLAEGLAILSKLSKLSLMRNKNEIKKAIGEADKEQIQIIKKFKKEFKKEKEADPTGKQDKKKQKGGEDSDGEGDCEDYNRAEKEEVLRRVAETVAPNMIFPRVLKPSIVYPTVTPKLFKYRQDYEQSQLKILYTKRASRYSGLRMPGNSYIQHFKGIELIKPDTKQLLM